MEGIWGFVLLIAFGIFIGAIINKIAGWIGSKLNFFRGIEKISGINAKIEDSKTGTMEYTSGDGVVIRVATSHDIEALCSFEREARITDPDIWCQGFDEADYRQKLIAVNIDKLVDSKVIIAIKSGRIIGRCDIAMILSLMDCKKTGYIDWIYTLKAHRGKGVGKLMKTVAESYFKQQGIKSYYLFTASNSEAQEFYHRQKDLEFSNKEVAEKELI